MTNQRFTDIEIGADIGQIRLYTTDEDYETYNGEELLNLINRLENAHERCRDTNKALHKDFDKLWQICKDNGLTEDEIIEAMDK